MVQADAQVEAQVSETLRIHGRIQAGGGGVTVSHGELHEQGSHNTFWQLVKRRPEYYNRWPIVTYCTFNSNV